MLSATELITVTLSGAAVVSASVIGTVYMAAENDSTRPAGAVQESGLHTDIGDAFFACTDQVAKVVPYRVRNLSVDDRSSRYDATANNHVVFLDMEVIERPGSFHNKHNYSAKVTCSVSAASNQVVGFKVRRM